MFYFFALVFFLDFAYRFTGGIPSVPPGLTPVELQWKIRSSAGESPVFVVGDSRVGWGISEDSFNKVLRARGIPGSFCLNCALPGSSIERVLNLVLDCSSRNGSPTILINFSPAGFYSFDNSKIEPIRNFRLQDMVDDTIGVCIKTYVAFHGRPLKSLFQHFEQYFQQSSISPKFEYVERIFFPDGFYNSRMQSSDGCPVNLEEYQIAYYRKIVQTILEEKESCENRKQKLVEQIVAAKKRGNRVLLFRSPVGEKMFSIESSLPDKLGPERIAHDSGVEFLTFQNDPRLKALQTIDQSHMAPASARLFSELLANKVIDYLHLERN